MAASRPSLPPRSRRRKSSYYICSERETPVALLQLDIVGDVSQSTWPARSTASPQVNKDVRPRGGVACSARCAPVSPSPAKAGHRVIHLLIAGARLKTLPGLLVNVTGAVGTRPLIR
jgi:hypothetical protein